jgi:hypothetical protein
MVKDGTSALHQSLLVASSTIFSVMARFGLGMAEYEKWLLSPPTGT